MKLKITQEDGQYDAAYGPHYFGYEIIYLENLNLKKRQMLFENKMALHGFWINDLQVSNFIENCFKTAYFLNNDFVKEYIYSLDNIIIIESYKARSFEGYDTTGKIIGIPDVVRSLNFITD